MAPVVPDSNRGQRIRNSAVAVVAVVALLTAITGLVVSRNTDSGTAGASTSEAIARIDSALAEIATAKATMGVGNTAGRAALDRATARLNEAKAELGAGPTPTPTPTPSPTPTVTPPSGQGLIGMSAPVGSWDQRVSEVGPGLQARRLFFSSFTDSLSKASEACADGMTPVMSFKTGSYSWAQVGSGSANSALASLATRINALPCDSFVAVHHEPNSDGTASDFTAMQVRALPILGGPLGGKVKVGVIGNGWWYNTNNQGLSDTELDAWVGASVRNVSDFIAADTYQGQTTAEDVASKMARQSAWASRTNARTPNSPVRAIGQGEWNVQSAQAVTAACTQAKNEPRLAFSLLWNNNGTGSANAHVLTGAMLTAFKNCLADW